jgi:hypothetical protein
VRALPLFAPAEKAIDTCVLPGVTDSEVGAKGSPLGVMVLEAIDGKLFPGSLNAVTRKM